MPTPRKFSVIPENSRAIPTTIPLVAVSAYIRKHIQPVQPVISSTKIQINKTSSDAFNIAEHKRNPQEEKTSIKQ